MTVDDRDLKLAHYYDLEYRVFTDDVDFYVQYAHALDSGDGAGVLELGCGTGRVALALAEAGFGVVGVDRSAGMLSLLSERARERGIAERIEAVKADMRDLSPVKASEFNIAFCALNTFAYLLTTEDQLAMLRAVRDKLVQHGVLILDLIPPFSDLSPPSDGTMLHQGSYPDGSDGSLVHKLVTGFARYSSQTHDVTIFYDREGLDGKFSRFSHSMTLRWSSRYETELLLNEAGYRVEKVYGSYELDEYADDADRMIFVART